MHSPTPGRGLRPVGKTSRGDGEGADGGTCMHVLARYGTVVACTPPSAPVHERSRTRCRAGASPRFGRTARPTPRRRPRSPPEDATSPRRLHRLLELVSGQTIRVGRHAAQPRDRDGTPKRGDDAPARHRVRERSCTGATGVYMPRRAINVQARACTFLRRHPPRRPCWFSQQVLSLGLGSANA